ncbi:MAG: diguanylate cyclase [Candidatus Accumulibacter sp.]|nr:diguanylate cyclase [Accumulibacter sp.]
MHPLLNRQIRRTLGELTDIPEAWRRLLGLVDAAYCEGDEDRRRLERMVELSSSELNRQNATLKHEIDERQQAETQLRESYKRLAVWVRRLESHNQQMALLNKLGDMLQACQHVAETHSILSQLLAQLFPGDAGSLALLGDPENFYEVVADWGDGVERKRQFHTDECWALRRGHAHQTLPGEGEASRCAHLLQAPPGGYLCVPLIAQGRMPGVLTLQQGNFETEDTDQEDHLGLLEARRQLVQMTSENIGLAIVNLRLRESLRKQSLRDPLTGLYNRRHMEDFIVRECRRAQRQQRSVSFMMADVDHFKHFNDQHGHQAGDALLAGLARALQQHMRGDDIACRYGGEEFIVILPGASLANVMQRAESLRRLVADDLRIVYDGEELPGVTLSIGVSTFPEHGLSGEQCIRAADDALYRAKLSGRDRVIQAE